MDAFWGICWGQLELFSRASGWTLVLKHVYGTSKMADGVPSKYGQMLRSVVLMMMMMMPNAVVRGDRAEDVLLTNGGRT